VKSNKPVMRRCISCRIIKNRFYLLKITKDQNLGISIDKNGIGRSAYLCKSEICTTDPKLKKNLQKALKVKLDMKFFEIISKEIQNYK
tara:strand:- start:25 stop:288 length:264 start_codon:yes stop_codon:yes gene_type:complete